jgi:hypothetical protein
VTRETQVNSTFVRAILAIALITSTAACAFASRPALALEYRHGVADGGHQTFVAFGVQNQATLPDDRVYELVSPANKNGGDIGFFGQTDVQAASSGQAVTYGSLTSFGTSQSAELISQYLSARSADGWTTQGISPPANFTGNASFSSPYEGFSADLATGLLAWSDPALTPGASSNYRNLYLRQSSTGAYQLVTGIAPANGSESRFVGASADYGHIVFQTGDALTEGAAANTQNVYEWFAGRLSLVSIPPNGTTGAPGSGAGNGAGIVQGAVSSDGSSIYWTDGSGQLYVREGGVHTTKVNASQRVPSLGDGTAAFFGATPDGRQVFFGDSTALTGAPGDNGGLYEFERDTGNLTDITPDQAGNPGLEGVLGYSSDGSSVYFVAADKLLGGATTGQPNLYVSRNGTLSFIATLSSDDSGDWATEPTSRHTAVTPDGAHVVFMSDASLTGYDNVDANTGKPDSEVFEYDAKAGQLHCVSCNPSGGAPIGPSSVPAWLNGNYNPRYLAEDGSRVFFDSVDTLTPRDTNGREDVYEWERNPTCGRSGGCVSLISDGIDASESLFADASQNGNDVFFTTGARLVSEDTDENIDLYDARVDGGFPVTLTQASCSDEACLGPLSTAPEGEGPLTALTASPQTGEGGHTPHPFFTVAPLGGHASSELVQTGRLTLHVHVSGAGKITANLTTRLAGHVKRVASGSTMATKAETVALALQMTRAALKQLAVRHKLSVTITVVFSGSLHAKRFAVIFDDQGRRR